MAFSLFALAKLQRSTNYNQRRPAGKLHVARGVGAAAGRTYYCVSVSPRTRRIACPRARTQGRTQALLAGWRWDSDHAHRPGPPAGRHAIVFSTSHAGHAAVLLNKSGQIRSQTYS